MTKEETTLLFAKISTYYPKLIENKSEAQVSLMIESWHELLEDITLQNAVIGLKKHVLNPEKGCFIPSVADIRMMALNINSNASTTEPAAAWGEVMAAVRKYGSYRITEAMESLSPTTRRVTEAIGFRSICMAEEEQQTFIRSQFMKMYQSIEKSERQDAILPESLKGNHVQIGSERILQLCNNS